MPQMAPYNWFILFMMFNMIILLIISMNYYIYIPKSLKFNSEIKMLEKFNLKW